MPRIEYVILGSLRAYDLEIKELLTTMIAATIPPMIIKPRRVASPDAISSLSVFGQVF